MDGKFCMLADDLTGAMDAGVQLIKKDIPTGVIFDARYVQRMTEMADVIIIDTESRNIDAKSAYCRVEAAASMLKAKGIKLIYKKIDSTLRGNIGAEMDAVIESRCADMIIAAPALPYNGRTTLNGCHYVDGERLENTELAKDPFFPVHTSYIPDIIKAQSAQKVAIIPISAIRGGKDALKKQIKKAYGDGYRIAVADALEDDDLKNIADAIADIEDIRVLPSGSAGLLGYIGDNLHICRQRQNICRAACGKPAAVISGTPARMTKAQIAYAVQAQEDVELFRINAATDAKAALRAISDALASKKSVIIDGADESKEGLMRKYGADKEALFNESSRILHILSSLAESIVSNFDISGLALLGGDTAASVSRALGAWGILISGEVEPYVPAGVMMLEGSDAGIAVVTKAGGFGNECTLKNIMEYLAGH